MKIYDCFNFFNELDILELRFNILYEHVDWFVIVESSVTHSGEEKPFYFEENKGRYSNFLDKIIYYKVYDTPTDFINLPKSEDKEVNNIYKFITNLDNRWFDRNSQPDYGRDFFQKECQRRPLIECSGEDVIMFSDVDEIPNPDILEDLEDLDLDSKIYRLNQHMYYYYFNVSKDPGWYGTRLMKYKNLEGKSLNDIRGHNHLSDPIHNAGWHFSFMGGEEMVRKKLISYSARDLAGDRVLSSVYSNIKNNIDPFFRGGLTLVDIDSTYPKYILNNLEKFYNFLKK
jgi:beta-1,4-mannosyl-glycoprotein beta-1,4-N-acetylglucosaminyltransferase